MTPFRVHILGCGSALPTLRHNPSSQVVEVRDKFFMVDCGEGTQMALRHTHVHFNKLMAIFISHLHGDHCFGLLGMLSSFGLLGRTAPLHIYAPRELQQLMAPLSTFFLSTLQYEVVVHDVDTTRQAVIYDDKSLSVETIPLRHRMPCCGFLFREKEGLRHIRRDMIDFYKVPLSQINNIRLGSDWTAPDGTIVANSRLTTAPSPVRSYAYCSDTAYLPLLHQQLQGVSTLYHEATYGDDFIEMAEKYQHSTARQAAQVASDAHVGKLVIGHFSQRYDDETILLNEAREVFPDTILAKEKLVIEV